MLSLKKKKIIIFLFQYTSDCIITVSQYNWVLFSLTVSSLWDMSSLKCFCYFKTFLAECPTRWMESTSVPQRGHSNKNNLYSYKCIQKICMKKTCNFYFVYIFSWRNNLTCLLFLCSNILSHKTYSIKSKFFEVHSTPECSYIAYTSRRGTKLFKLSLLIFCIRANIIKSIKHLR